jgi:hypothetical protein
MKKLKALSFLSTCVLALGLILASCEDNISFANPGATNPGTTNPGGNNGGLDSVVGLANKLIWLKTNAQSGGNYTIVVDSNESIESQELSYSGKSNITLNLEGSENERIVTLSTNGALFTVGSGVTLALGRNITLRGRSGNTSPLVYVISGGGLIMNANSKITSNTNNANTKNRGGGVYVEGGTFTMQDNALVSGNTSYYDPGAPRTADGDGGGVCVYGGTFTMQNNASVSGNTSGAIGGGVSVDKNSTFTIQDNASVSSNTAGNAGAGVAVANGSIFYMEGGKVSNNKGNDGAIGVFDGTCGVYITDNSTFTMQGNATIYNNSCGGVNILGRGCTFTMQGNASVSGNSAATMYYMFYGGGVYFDSDGGTFTMRSNASVSGNSAGEGGGVYLGAGTFTMNSGTISSNTASSKGGGVWVSAHGIFNNNYPSGIRGNSPDDVYYSSR